MSHAPARFSLAMLSCVVRDSVVAAHFFLTASASEKSVLMLTARCVSIMFASDAVEALVSAADVKTKAANKQIQLKY